MGEPNTGSRINRWWTPLVRWFDSDYDATHGLDPMARPDQVEWVRCLPFIFLHGGCLGVLWTGVSWFSAGAAVFLYFARMFAVTGFFHRYFSHRTFSTSRAAQFVFAVWGGACAQRGALWWAYSHRHHHQHSDQPGDKHSPRQRGFLWAHIGWIMSGRNFPTDYRRVRDLARFPELVFLNRFDALVPLAYAGGVYALGKALQRWAPGLGVTGWQLVVWGFFISTTALFHGTCTINSLSHVFGRRRYETGDDSRNNPMLALITMGEGWHNNHHRHMGTVRQGFYWWEFDPTFYLLKAMAWTGLIWNLKPVPADAYDPEKQLPRGRR